MNACDAKAERDEFGCLVFHEGDERGDHQRCAAAGKRGQLIAEALAGASGHDQQQVAARDGGTANFFLIGAEGGEAEDRVQKLGEVAGWDRRVHGCGQRPVSTVRQPCLPGW